MKKAVLLIFCLLAIQFLVIAQTDLPVLTYPSEADTTDPYLGNYVLGNSAELVFQCVNRAGLSSRYVYDFNSEGFQSR